MKVSLPLRKAYNRFANYCKLDGYDFGSKTLGLRQQYKMVRNRLTATAGMTGLLGAETLACASTTGRAGDMALFGILGVLMGCVTRLFHKDLMKLQKMDAYKAIEKRAQNIFA
ncbi:hypothetical protein IKP85_04315 [bacterium]|nr:hypothetical protein [bacterium]